MKIAVALALWIAIPATAQIAGQHRKVFPAGGGGGGSWTITACTPGQKLNTSGPATCTFTGTTSVGDYFVTMNSCFSATTGRCAANNLSTDTQSNTWSTPVSSSTSSSGFIFESHASIASGKTGTNPTISFGTSATAFYTVAAFWVHWTGTSISLASAASTNSGVSATYTSGSVTVAGSNFAFIGGCTDDNAVASTSYNNGFTKSNEILTGQDVYTATKTGAGQTTSLSISAPSDHFACALMALQGN